MFLQEKKSQMLHVDVLCVKNMEPKKKVSMNVYAVSRTLCCPLFWNIAYLESVLDYAT